MNNNNPPPAILTSADIVTWKKAINAERERGMMESMIDIVDAKQQCEPVHLIQRLVEMEERIDDQESLLEQQQDEIDRLNAALTYLGVTVK